MGPANSNAGLPAKIHVLFGSKKATVDCIRFCQRVYTDEYIGIYREKQVFIFDQRKRLDVASCKRRGLRTRQVKTKAKRFSLEMFG